MLISKFNKMIRNRALWAAFAIIISISFVGLFTQGGGCDGTPAAAGSGAGTIGGETVERAELLTQKFHVYLWLRLVTGRELPMNADTERELEEQAWRRIATLRKARALGLATQDAEVISAIRRDPMFAVEGQFSQNRYASFLQTIGQSMGVSARRFEEYVREEVTIDKLRRMVAAAVWVSPFDMNEQLRNATDMFTVEYAPIAADAITTNVSVGPDRVVAFFEANRESFRIPPRVRVVYTAFPVADFTGAVAVSAGDVTNYYNAHIEEYAVTDTNGATSWVEVDDVRPDIEALLVQERAAAMAEDRAVAFVDRLIPERGGRAVALEDAAQAAGLAWHTTPLFSRYEALTNIAAGLEFNEAAFALAPTPDEHFSEPVEGADAFFVLSLQDSEDARLPELAEVMDDVEAAALFAEKQSVFTERANEIAAALRDAVAAGTPFAEAAAGLGLEAQTPEPFSAYTAPESLSARPVLGEILQCRAGDVTEPLPDAGGALVAYVANRQPGEAMQPDAVREQIRNGISRQMARALLTDWERSLMADVERQAQEPEPDDAEEPDDAAL